MNTVNTTIYPNTKEHHLIDSDTTVCYYALDEKQYSVGGESSSGEWERIPLSETELTFVVLAAAELLGLKVTIPDRDWGDEPFTLDRFQQGW
jgi:hypothetical protein